MKILVTGVAGFIGFQLVRGLLADGFEVVGIDNLNDYFDVNLKYGRLQELGIRRSSIANAKSTLGGRSEAIQFPRFDLTDDCTIRAGM